MPSQNTFKERKKREAAMRKAGRLPPGQVLTEKFPVLHYGAIPEFKESEWIFRIWGEVEQPLKLTWQAFMELPRIKVDYDLHCVTRWSKFDTNWEGVRFNTFIEAGLITLKPSAKFILQHAENDYTTNLPIDLVQAETFLLATHFEGEPISPEHGYPLRGLVGAIPGRKDLKDVYLWKGAKWLTGLEILSDDQKGFWELAGYHNEGDVWKEERFTH
jgi:DMSO/TMAO reductase YedYZ molybdopterin-dependent catalytic subunit